MRVARAVTVVLDRKQSETLWERVGDRIPQLSRWLSRDGLPVENRLVDWVEFLSDATWSLKDAGVGKGRRFQSRRERIERRYKHNPDGFRLSVGQGRVVVRADLPSGAKEFTLGRVRGMHTVLPVTADWAEWYLKGRVAYGDVDESGIIPKAARYNDVRDVLLPAFTHLPSIVRLESYRPPEPAELGADDGVGGGVGVHADRLGHAGLFLPRVTFDERTRRFSAIGRLPRLICPMSSNAMGRPEMLALGFWCVGSDVYRSNSVYVLDFEALNSADVPPTVDEVDHPMDVEECRRRAATAARFLHWSGGDSRKRDAELRKRLLDNGVLDYAAEYFRDPGLDSCPPVVDFSPPAAGKGRQRQRNRSTILPVGPREVDEKHATNQAGETSSDPLAGASLPPTGLGRLQPDRVSELLRALDRIQREHPDVRDPISHSPMESIAVVRRCLAEIRKSLADMADPVLSAQEERAAGTDDARRAILAANAVRDENGIPRRGTTHGVLQAKLDELAGKAFESVEFNDQMASDISAETGRGTGLALLFEGKPVRVRCVKTATSKNPILQLRTADAAQTQVYAGTEWPQLTVKNAQTMDGPEHSQDNLSASCEEELGHPTLEELSLVDLRIRLEEARQAAGKSQQEVGILLGYPAGTAQQNVHDLLAGVTDPGILRVGGYARVLGLSLADLLAPKSGHFGHFTSNVPELTLAILQVKMQRALEASGVTQNEVAEFMRTTKAHVSNILRRQSSDRSIFLIDRFARATGHSLSDMLRL